MVFVVSNSIAFDKKSFIGQYAATDNTVIKLKEILGKLLEAQGPQEYWDGYYTMHKDMFQNPGKLIINDDLVFKMLPVRCMVINSKKANCEAASGTSNFDLKIDQQNGMFVVYFDNKKLEYKKTGRLNLW